MSSESPSPKPVHIRYRGAIWTLLLLAPFIAEVLSGSTRLSFLFVFIPEVMVWGGGAVLARELVKRWRAGGTSLLFLGLALSVAEEFIIQQTSIAPLPFLGANATIGRAFGVNWIYLLFMLGYESVWVVVIPVQVTELFFPNHARNPWLRVRGLITTCFFFLLGSFMAWFGWTQQARKRLGAAPYSPPLALLAAGLTAIALLILLAWLMRNVGHSRRNAHRQAMSPWIAGFVTLAFSTAWWELIAVIFVPRNYPPASTILIAGSLWAILAYLLLQFLCAPAQWSAMHRWACCFGAVLSGLIANNMSTAGWTQPDLIAKWVFQSIAIAGFIILALRIHARLAKPALSAD